MSYHTTINDEVRHWQYNKDRFIWAQRYKNSQNKLYWKYIILLIVFLKSYFKWLECCCQGKIDKKIIWNDKIWIIYKNIDMANYKDIKTAKKRNKNKFMSYHSEWIVLFPSIYIRTEKSIDITTFIYLSFTQWSHSVHTA